MQGNNTAIDFYYRVDFKTKTYQSFAIFIDKSDMDKWIKKRSKRKDFQVINIQRCMSM